MAQQMSARNPRYKRILLKLSGEALMGTEDFGIDPKVLDRMALEVGQLVGIGVEVGLVIGGGNLFRGAALSAAGMDRVTGDHMGMLATVMNALAMRDALERSPGVQVYQEYVDAVNLGWSVEDRSDLELPGYEGALELRYARPSDAVAS